MRSSADDLDLTQAHAYALQPADLAVLLGTVDTSLSASLSLLQEPADLSTLHRTLHDLKGYLGLVASSALCERVQQADLLAREGQASTHEHVRMLIPRLKGLQRALQVYRAGIIGD